MSYNLAKFSHYWSPNSKSGIRVPLKMYTVNNSIRLQKGRLKRSFSLGTAAVQGK